MKERRGGAVEPPPWRGRGTGGGSRPLLRTRRGGSGCDPQVEGLAQVKDTIKRAKNQKRERKTKESEQSHVNMFTGANSRFLAKGIIAMHRNVFLFFLVFHSEREYFRHSQRYK